MYLCEECGQPCDIQRVDVGLGKTECYGSVTNDVNMIEVSDCCRADFIDINMDGNGGAKNGNKNDAR